PRNDRPPGALPVTMALRKRTSSLKFELRPGGLNRLPPCWRFASSARPEPSAFCPNAGAHVAAPAAARIAIIRRRCVVVLMARLLRAWTRPILSNRALPAEFDARRGPGV